MANYKHKQTGEKLVLLRKRKQINVFECVERPMEPTCKGAMAHPRIVVSDIRFEQIIEVVRDGH